MRSSPPWLRLTIHATFSAMWLIGVAVFVLKHFFRTASEFGPAVHPWQPTLTEIHGIVAVLATFLFGWIAADHVAVTWRGAADRVSGVALIVLLALLIATGFASFFLALDSWRDSDAALHEYLGLALFLPWLVHLTWGRRRKNGELRA